MKQLVAGIVGLVALVGSVSGAHLYLDARYATAAQVEQEGRETRSELIRAEIRQLEDKVFVLERKESLEPYERALLEKYRRRLDDLRARLRRLE